QLHTFRQSLDRGIPAPDHLLSVQQTSLDLAASIDDGRGPIDAQDRAIIAERNEFGRVSECYRAGGIRTRGLLHPRQALYQAEPQPELHSLSPRSNRRAHPISRITCTEARSNKCATQVASTKFTTCLYANRPSPCGDGRAKPNKQATINLA